MPYLSPYFLSPLIKLCLFDWEYKLDCLNCIRRVLGLIAFTIIVEFNLTEAQTIYINKK